MYKVLRSGKKQSARGPAKYLSKFAGRSRKPDILQAFPIEALAKR
jgi:hypothetical protein